MDRKSTPDHEILIPLLESVDESSVEMLDEHLLLLEAARNRLDVEWTEVLGAFETKNGHDLFGYPSTVAYLKHRFSMVAARANRYVRLARSASRFLETFQSWRLGILGSDQTAELLRTAERFPDEYADDETGMIEACGDTPAETKKFLDYWSQSADRTGHLEPEKQQERRRLDYTRNRNGMIEGSFALTPTVGEAFITSIESLLSPPGTDDERTATQRRHDALEDLVFNHLDRAESTRGGQRPHITVHVDVDALQADPGGLHETTGETVLDVGAIRRLSCDSLVSRVVFDPKSEIIDVGRKTRVIPAALRLAVIARDRHCTHPGCDRPPDWCDVHHIIHWADGGETELDNLRLLCRYHHTLQHLYDSDHRFHTQRALESSGRST